MKNIIDKLKTWLLTSSHYKHVLACFALSFCLGWQCGVGAGIAAEYKDYAWGGLFDWSDIGADAVGIVLGSALRLVVLGRI